MNKTITISEHMAGMETGIVFIFKIFKPILLPAMQEAGIPTDDLNFRWIVSQILAGAYVTLAENHAAKGEEISNIHADAASALARAVMNSSHARIALAGEEAKQ